MKPSDVVFIGPSPLKLLGTMGLGGLGIIVGFVLLSEGLFGRWLLLSYGWLIVGLVGGLVISFYVWALLRRRPSVELGPDAFVAKSLFGSRTRRWDEVEGDFVVIQLGWSRAIGYRLTTAFKEAAKIKPTTLFAGNDEAISGSYTSSIHQLVELLNQHKRAALGGSLERT